MRNTKNSKKPKLLSFEASIRKAMGKNWDRLSEDEKRVVHELSECERGKGGIPPDER